MNGKVGSEEITRVEDIKFLNVDATRETVNLFHEYSKWDGYCEGWASYVTWLITKKREEAHLEIIGLRPVACLGHMHKWFMRCMLERLRNHTPKIHVAIWH